MIKTLLKKQMLEAFSWLYFNARDGKRRDAKGILIFSALYLFVFASLGFFFYTIAQSLCSSLCAIGYGWLYFALISLMAVFAGVFGSVFNTYSSLYKAQDNDLLLSMPITARQILVVRLSGVYVLGLLYEMIVMLPALIAWFIYGNVSPLGILFCIIIPFVLSFLILTFSCLLGWVIALFSGKFKNENAISVIISLAFIAVYYYIYFNANKLLTSILSNPGGIAKVIKSWLYPLYHLGFAASGEPISMLIFTGFVGLIFVIIYLLMSHSFFKLATVKKGNKKNLYKIDLVKSNSINTALFKKELKRFTSSANYMLNCGMGILLMIIAAVFLVIKGEMLVSLIPLLYNGAEEIIPLIITCIVCFTLSAVYITAPSVSLEGKNIWILQMLPVRAWQVLKAKLMLQLILTLPSALFLTLCAVFVLKPTAISVVLIVITVFLFAIFTAVFGLYLNLKTPNLAWKSEIVPIKQSFSVTVVLFGGWIILVALGVGYYFLSGLISPNVYLIIVSCLFLLVDFLILKWLKGKGSKVFEKL